MHQIVRTRQADADLLEIWLYFAQESLDRADDLLTKLEEGYQILKDYPFAGRSRNELVPELRSLTVGNYQVFYRVVQQRVEILRILHGARDIERIFAEEPL
jgi:toxin ParE1/3/4